MLRLRTRYFLPAFSAFAAVLGLSTLGACADARHARNGTEPAEPAAGQEPEARSAADAEKLAALQRKVDEISPRVAELRGMQFKHPVPAGIHTPDEFLEFAKKDLESEMSIEQFNAMGEALALFGLVDGDSSLFDTVMELLRGQVGGYYDPKTKKFYMISTFNEGMLADIIMAHELTHALDDQYYDLAKMMEGTSDNMDRQFAIRAVVEGSGTSLMNLYTVQGMMKGWISMQPEDMEAMQEMMEEQMEQIQDAPPFLVITLALPYMEGNKLLVRNSSMLAAATLTPKAEDLDHAFRNPPSSSEQVLHFDKYWDPGQRDEPAPVELPDLSAQVGAGWKLAYSDTLGELGCYFLVIEELPDLMSSFSGMGPPLTDPSSEGWDGDRFQLYTGPGGAKVLVWASVWDTPDEASEFAAALAAVAQPRTPALRRVAETSGGVLALFANEAGTAVLERTRLALAAAAPRWN
ncbi:MAG: hypothetical protein EYC70_00780 [Planctomycetota bacterium]|nr:MAG: hypothetical protein EYC70_00780 [Planctomycetota bacterium]